MEDEALWCYCEDCVKQREEYDDIMKHATNKKVRFKKKDPIENMTQVGAEVFLMTMGSELKFKWNGINYTIKREIED